MPAPPLICHYQYPEVYGQSSAWARKVIVYTEEMASWMGGLRVVMRSRALLRPALLQSRRPASQMSMQGNENLLIAGAVGIMGITTYLVRSHSSISSDMVAV